MWLPLTLLSDNCFVFYSVTVFQPKNYLLFSFFSYCRPKNSNLVQWKTRKMSKHPPA